jgi:hypothetical protein
MAAASAAVAAAQPRFEVGEAHRAGSAVPGERHLEVRVGNVETQAGTRHVFATATKSDTEAMEVIERCLAGAGRTAGTRLSAFTDGCAGLRKLLTDIGVKEPPILDWFHIAMGLQHLRQAAQGLPTCDAGPPLTSRQSTPSVTTAHLPARCHPMSGW